MAVESTELHHLRATTTRNDPQDVAEASEDATTQALQVQELHPVDRGFHAYWFLASAMFTDAIVYGQPGSYGVFLEWYLSHPPFQGQSPALISFVGTIALAIQYFEMLLLVPLIRRYPDKVKPAMVVALVVQVACYVGASFSTRIWQLVLLQGVLVGISGGVLTVPQFVYIADWFDEKRGTASGLMLAGTGLGGTVLPVVMGAILDKLGYAAALRIWAGIVAVSVGLTLPGIKPRTPIVKQKERAPFMPVRIIFHKRPVFWVFIAVLMLQNLSYVPVSLYLPTYAASLGASRTNGNLSLSAFNIASTLSRFSFGYLTDRHSYIHITVIATVTASLVTFLVWGWAKDLALLLVFAIAYGLFAGGFSSSWSPAARDLSWPDQQQNSSLFGLFGAVKGLAAVVGPLTAAKLYDPLAQRQDYGGKGFGSLVVFTGALMLGSGACALLMRPVQRLVDVRQ